MNRTGALAVVSTLVVVAILIVTALAVPERADAQYYGTAGIVRTDGITLTGNGRASDTVRLLPGAAWSVGELTATTSAGAHTLIETSTATNTAVIVANIRATSTGTSADGFGPQIGFQHDGAGATVPTTLYWLSGHRAGADNTGQFRGYANVAGSATHGFTVDSDGDVHFLGNVFSGSPTAGTSNTLSSLTLTAGAGLAGGGVLNDDRTFSITDGAADGVTVDADGVTVNVSPTGGTTRSADAVIVKLRADANPGLTLVTNEGLGVLFGANAGNAAQGNTALTVAGSSGAFTFSTATLAVGGGGTWTITPVYGASAGNFVQGSNTLAVVAGAGLAEGVAATALGAGNLSIPLSITDGAADGVTVNADGVTVNVSPTGGTTRSADAVIVKLRADANPGLTLVTNEGLGVLFGANAGNAAQGNVALTLAGSAGAFTFSTATLAVGGGGTWTVTPVYGTSAGNFVQGTVTLEAIAGTGLTGGQAATALGSNNSFTVNAVGGAGLTAAADSLDVGAGAGITVNADDVALNLGSANVWTGLQSSTNTQQTTARVWIPWQNFITSQETGASTLLMAGGAGAPGSSGELASASIAGILMAVNDEIATLWHIPHDLNVARNIDVFLVFSPVPATELNDAWDFTLNYAALTPGTADALADPATAADTDFASTAWVADSGLLRVGATINGGTIANTAEFINWEVILGAVTNASADEAAVLGIEISYERRHF